MKTYNNLWERVISFENLIVAWKKARKGKTTKSYVIEFDNYSFWNLLALHYELKYGTYEPKPLDEFIVRDPKTRRIAKSEFRDRIVHHAIVNILEPIYEGIFIYDSSANRIGKGNLFALKRFNLFQRKVTSNLRKDAFCLKADIKHYFQEIDKNILMDIIKKKISDRNLLGLIYKINTNFDSQRERES